MKSQQQINPWKLYEERKMKLRKLDLPFQQFLEEINKILKELDL